MRARPLLVIATLAGAIAACSPTVEGGAYYCGPDELCPTGLQCDGDTNTCVAPFDVTTFTCDEGPALSSPGCAPIELGTSGCVRTADGHDRVTLTTAAGCPMKVTATITYPVAFMPIAVTARDAGGTAVATSAPCGSIHGGSADACVALDVAPASTYTFDVAAVAGAGACQGACAFNRYALSVHLLRP